MSLNKNPKRKREGCKFRNNYPVTLLNNRANKNTFCQTIYETFRFSLKDRITVSPIGQCFLRELKC